MTCNSIWQMSVVLPSKTGNLASGGNAGLSEARSGSAGAMRQDPLASRKLFPANPEVIEAEVRPAGSSPQASRNQMAPNCLVAECAQIDVPAEFVENMARDCFFEKALLDQASLSHRRSAAERAVSLAIHAAVLAAVLIVPLIYTPTINLQQHQLTYLSAPPIQASLRPQFPPAAKAPQHISLRQPFNSPILTTPIAIPETTQTARTDPEALPEAASLAGGSMSGVPGWQVGGTFEGVLEGALSEEQAAPPPPPQPTSALQGPLHVGGKVKPPQLLSDSAPDYPRQALISKIQGDVEIDAVIDRDGNVVQAHVITGPPMLISAALKAVSMWKYAPTYLNGKRCPVELTVHMTFILGA